MTQPGPTPAAWLSAYARVQKAADRDILAMLRRSLAEIRKDIAIAEARAGGGIGNAIQVEQMRRIQAAMLREQARIFGELQQEIPRRRAEAAARAIDLGVETDSALFRVAGMTSVAPEFRRALTEGLLRTTEVAVTRMTQSQFPLSERIYRTQIWMGGRVQAKINSALARGLTPRQFANEALDWFSPSTPGGMRYAAMRLARTEINNAYHAIAVNAAAEKPWVSGMKWHLSGSHPKADECDELAHEDRFKMGPGVFPPKDVPRKPHPQCLCQVTPVVVDEDEFFDNLLGGNYDDYLARKRAGLGAPGAGGQVSPGGRARPPGLAGNPMGPDAQRRAAAAARQQEIAQKTGFANLAADVNKAEGRIAPTAKAISEARRQGFISRADRIRYDGELSFGGPRAAALIDRDAASKGLRRIGNAGTQTRYDPDVHAGPTGSRLRRGQAVTVQRRGYSAKLDSGEEVRLFKAQVVKAPTVSRRSPERIAARQHVNGLAKGVSPNALGSKTVIKKELQRQADTTPKAMLQLRGVLAGPSQPFSYGLNSGVGAYYSPGIRTITLHPRWVGDKAEFDKIERSFESARKTGWHSTPHASSSLAGTTAHEYGHHVHFMMSNGPNVPGFVGAGWGMPAQVADRLLPVLSQELGVSLPRSWKPGQTFLESDFDQWVANRRHDLAVKVSRYGAKSAAELMAEIWAEYTTAGPKARPYIRNIGEVIRQLAEASS